MNVCVMALPLCACLRAGFAICRSYSIPDVIPGARLRMAGNGTLGFYSFLQGLPRKFHRILSHILTASMPWNYLVA